MIVMLDAHVLLWWWADDPRLGQPHRQTNPRGGELGAGKDEAHLWARHSALDAREVDVCAGG